MTTVVYRDGTIASDSLGVSGSTKLPGTFQKIFRLRDGTLVGMAGDYHTAVAAIRGASCAAEIKAMPDYNDNNSILCIARDGSMRMQSKGVWIPLGSPDFYAIGSGRDVALGAMQVGATAEEAIRAAHKTDIYTDDRVNTLSFSSPEIVPEADPRRAPSSLSAQKLTWRQRLLGVL